MKAPVKPIEISLFHFSRENVSNLELDKSLKFFSTFGFWAALLIRISILIFKSFKESNVLETGY